MIDNSSMKKLLLVLLILLMTNTAHATERIGIISDALIVRTTAYSAYFRTPDFLLQDVYDILSQNPNFSLVPISETKTKLYNGKISERDLHSLRNIEQGYELNFLLLKKIANIIEVDKLVIITQGIEMERDFLKPTLWNSLNIAGFDVVNPTQRVNVYVALVDCQNESVMWENIYAKNIRNNKMKNLDTTVSNNYEGLMRLKMYSKYISPEIATNVTNAILPNYIAPTVYASRAEGVIMAANKKMRIGSDKQLSNTGYLSAKLSKWSADRKKRREAKKMKKLYEKEQKAILKEAL